MRLITLIETCNVLKISMSTLSRLRNNDSNFPESAKKNGNNKKIYFKLQEILNYRNKK